MSHRRLVLVLGASLKGLGAAGLDMDKEDKRVQALITEAEKNRPRPISIAPFEVSVIPVNVKNREVLLPDEA